MLCYRYVCMAWAGWLLAFAAQADDGVPKSSHGAARVQMDETVPAQVEGTSFISLNAIVSSKPFRARVNYIGDESLAMELMFALSDGVTGKVIWLEQRRTSQYMFEVSSAKVDYDAQRYQLQAYQVIRPILLAELTPKIAPQPSQAQRASGTLSSADSQVDDGQCSIARTKGETFWQLAKQYAKVNQLKIYDSVVSLFYSNLSAFAGANIEKLSAARLRCPSVQQVQWWQQRGDSHKVYRQLLQGASHSEVIDLDEMPK